MCVRIIKSSLRTHPCSLISLPLRGSVVLSAVGNPHLPDTADFVLAEEQKEHLAVRVCPTDLFPTLTLEMLSFSFCPETIKGQVPEVFQGGRRL